MRSAPLAALDDDACREIADALLLSPYLGEVGVVMLSRTARRLWRALAAHRDAAGQRWRAGFHAAREWRFGGRDAAVVDSPVFQTPHGHQWCLFALPRGGAGGGAAIYLEVANAALLPAGWRREIAFRLRVYPADAARTGDITTVTTRVVLSAECKDYGFLAMHHGERDRDWFHREFVWPDGTVRVAVEVFVRPHAPRFGTTAAAPASDAAIVDRYAAALGPFPERSRLRCVGCDGALRCHLTRGHLGCLRHGCERAPVPCAELRAQLARELQPGVVGQYNPVDLFGATPADDDGAWCAALPWRI